MKANKQKTMILFAIVSGLLILSLILIIVTKDRKGKNREITKKAAASALFGGMTADNMTNPCLNSEGKPIAGCRNNQKGLFDENDPESFMGTKGLDFSENAAKNADNDGEYPMNPQTGKPYDEEAMQQFDELRKSFPQNDLIPKKSTKADKERKAEKDALAIKAMNAFTSGKYTAEDVSIHFETQSKAVKDRIEIIDFLIESQKDEGEKDKDGQFQKILDGAKDQLKQVEAQRDEALSKLR